MEVNTKAGQIFLDEPAVDPRQDPDVIGQIRDQETASIAARRQHRTHGLPTVHQRRRHSPVPLLDLRPHDRLPAGVLGQPSAHLRRVQGAVKPKRSSRESNLPADKSTPTGVPRIPNRLQQCGDWRFRRTGILSFLSGLPMREMIRENPSINKIKAEARKNGMIYLQEDGLRQVIQGRTSIEELLRGVK
jgi:type II secretory ATPase GspE/PulE/Tfp pilus assembly ATPase PilB-like protein